MNKIKNFALNLFIELKVPNLGRKIVFAMGLIFFLVSIVNIAGLLYETRATKGVVFAKDNDAGRGIQTATLTRWWNSNHFAPYGNLYFRFAHTLAYVVPSNVESVKPDMERIELRHHFALMLTSLLFLASLCLCLGFLISKNWTVTIWLGTILFQLAVYDQTWVEFLFRVHPDHTLMFFCLLGSYFTLRYTKSSSHSDFIRAALFWGIATAVKRSTILFIPSFLYLFLSEGLNRESVKKGFTFAGYMLLSYLIVGFPQNFGFYKHIYFLYIETFNSIPATKDSVFDYLRLILSQSYLFWLAFIPMHLLFGVRENLINKRFVIFSVIAILVVLAGNMKSIHNHHIMPHVALMLILVLYSVKKLPVLNYPKKILVLLIIATATLIILPSSNALLARKDKQLDCRKEINQILELVTSFQKDGKILVRDPYFPFSASYKDRTKQIWGINGEILDQEDAYLWGTQKGFLNNLKLKPYRPHIYPDLTLEQWTAKVDLAAKAQKESNFTTPSGKVFEKIHEDSCGYMVFKRKD